MNCIARPLFRDSNRKPHPQSRIEVPCLNFGGFAIVLYGINKLQLTGQEENTISKKFSRTKMLEAMKSRDSRYDGVFFVGVKTMKIYCLPSCKAKLPLQENVIFFLKEEEALAANYRPCLRCKPNLFPNTKPLWIDKCLKCLHENTDKKVLDSELAELAGVEISTLRRTFAAIFKKTPAGYHREVRLKKAAGSLSHNKPIVQVSEDVGFESLSGFVDAFRKRFGVSPGNYEGK